MNGKAFTILNTSCLSEPSRIMAAKTLKNLGSISVSGQLPTYPSSLIQQQSIDKMWAVVQTLILIQNPYR